jgi:serine/threonine-protein kinase
MPRDSARDEPTRPDRAPARVLGKYRLLRQVGAGGMGVVHEADDEVLQRKVAVKVLLDRADGPGGPAERFLREARAAARLSHPNVVPIYDVGQANGTAFLVMEYLPGGSVQQMLQARGRLPWEQAVPLVVQAGRGLAAAHAAGLIHRDVKLANLMLAADGTVKVADFGLAKVVEGDALGAAPLSGSRLLGTPHYMSPEQCSGEPLDARTDVYSLAVCLYALLTGRLPFDSENVYRILYAHCSATPPDAGALAPDLPAGLLDVLRRGMGRPRGSRYATMNAFVAALEGALGGMTHQTPAAPIAPRRLSRRAVVLGLAAAVAGVAAAGLWRLWGGGSTRRDVPIDVKGVETRLRRANPEWKGSFEPDHDGERLVGLKLRGDDLTDLSPLTALRDLEELEYVGPSWCKGKLKDLGPLAEMTGLQRLTIQHSTLSDLTPLSRLKLEKLDVVATPVSNLKPLRGVPLKALNVHGTRVTDLGPLSKCALLECLYCPGTLLSLDGLQLLPLKRVHLYGCGKVTSLRPLADSPVEFLDCRGVGVDSLDELAAFSHLRELLCDEHYRGKVPALPNLKRVEFSTDFRSRFEEKKR